jgi:hypothetical protein
VDDQKESSTGSSTREAVMTTCDSSSGQDALEKQSRQKTSALRDPRRAVRPVDMDSS